MKKIFIIGLTMLGFQTVFSQNYTRKDTLQGGLRFERTCFDVLLYDLDIKIDPVQKSIFGVNKIAFKVVENTKKIQIDLFENMQIDSIMLQDKSTQLLDKKLKYKREFNAVFIDFDNELVKGEEQAISFYYSGKPTIAKNAPWDGGFVWSKDKNGKPWIGVACQGTGASLWFPCKDSQSDEPDLGAFIQVTVPNDLMEISNGRLLSKTDLNNGYSKWIWRVYNPINAYDITVNIADYAQIHDSLNGLDLDYYVLKENEEKAKVQFDANVKPMLTCFQEKFGEYPFKSDGYKLVETPFLGMEHQSAVAYGNKYKQGYLGSDLSGTGIGLLFDFIIIHESGHEWFGNSITSKDIADMWIHEGFTCYSESVFLECNFGIEKAQKYINGLRKNIDNDIPIIGPYGVNKEGSGDMYYKGALMLNTLRHVINNDDLWWKIILNYAETFKYKIIDTETVVAFFNKESGMNLTPVFNQYLRYKNIPTLELQIVKKKLQYKWNSDVTDFNMPIAISVNDLKTRIQPTTDWKKTKIKIKNLNQVEVLTNDFFVNVKKD